MGLSEADTRAKLIDPALHARGRTEDLIRREETAGAVEIVEGRPRRRARGRVDYTLRVTVGPGAQPVAMALIEAKAEDLPPTHGLEQAKAYAACKRLNVPFVLPGGLRDRPARHLPGRQDRERAGDRRDAGGPGRQEPDGRAHGAQPLEWHDVLREALPVPPVDSQNRVAKKIEEWMATASALRAVADEQTAVIEALPTALLRRAFNEQL